MSRLAAGLRKIVLQPREKMMTILKSATVYVVDLPDAGAMRRHLAEMPHVDLTETMFARGGFVARDGAISLVTDIAGGYSFRYRWDEKIMPQAAINAEVQHDLAKIVECHADLSRQELKKLKGEIREAVITRMLKVAFVKTTVVDVFYLPDRKYLVVPSVSKDFCSGLLYAVTQCVGSLKSSTIHISNLKLGITTKLRSDLVDVGYEQSAFYPFCCGDHINLVGEHGAKVTVSNGIESAKQGVIDAISNGFMQVSCIELYAQDGASTFRLTSDFRFKSINLEISSEDEEIPADDIDGIWRSEAAVQLALFAGIVDDLCELMGYEPETEADESAG